MVGLRVIVEFQATLHDNMSSRDSETGLERCTLCPN